ncbi:Cu(I)-responsive transcriptional regulator [Agrobacterium vitis]|uniref:Cu(I)-responsive transcriptional regulator n=1 Tax=Agrobacterium vitis TaxID=373 RepID=A0AAE2UT30_AGRVI|nr:MULTISPECIES: Cu(I)-responsive transcriptional regulator [Rhizobium/Agrobacterium group]MBF2716733.1 Cu(I)-responsive transcriptional regulator [Agrobacterium vitis]MCF1434501.1 Cu(I)-responsive transcriptional regulator [Allorhizobium ampelinum]MUO92691.1 Cu(I)-responsive transcriptional regulator [Agrobacterium vitis]MUZ54335.1 Cu(I)-responsive transcriptional regulator [Agrobacterium vitis]MUZ66394.1 Cu(I)-responsive transcriptional regulator [Agrobacterium vitis]
MNIGEAAAASGVSAKMIRYYEEIGLVLPARRTSSNYRVYGENEVHRLRFVRRARTLGFSLEETERLLALWSDSGRKNDDVRQVAMNHLRELEDKMEAMQAMVDTLKNLVDHCEQGDRPDCPILEKLGGSPTHNSRKVEMEEA